MPRHGMAPWQAQNIKATQQPFYLAVGIKRPHLVWRVPQGMSLHTQLCTRMRIQRGWSTTSVWCTSMSASIVELADHESCQPFGGIRAMFTRNSENHDISGIFCFLRSRTTEPRSVVHGCQPATVTPSTHVLFTFISRQRYPAKEGPNLKEFGQATSNLPKKWGLSYLMRNERRKHREWRGFCHVTSQCHQCACGRARGRAHVCVCACMCVCTT